MKPQFIALFAISAASALNAPPPTVLSGRAAMAEYDRVTSLVETARRNYDAANSPNEVSSPIERRCDRLNDPCCPDGADSCVPDMCGSVSAEQWLGCLLDAAVPLKPGLHPEPTPPLNAAHAIQEAGSLHHLTGAAGLRASPAAAVDGGASDADPHHARHGQAPRRDLAADLPVNSSSFFMIAWPVELS
ncbi:hypothetical protein QBC34DRAFT_429182 [Podospora aff. communis PSN243]|uniref:Uncharacterized protein n=1 Tax=Podospora aff. communis PSN243 TaxID=3040156 RepID=A0AAV9GAM9_9PEZI|nr:hypothetical protein QBC34DRAFT_429182 [Podospora aff. communis PSN243]